MLTVTACLVGLVATIVCLRASYTLRGTTLAAPCMWAAASLGLVICAVVAGSFAGDSPRATWAAHVDYLVGITMLAPFVALLGAKRPQDRAWQLIVAALLALLAFQDFRTWTIDPSLSPTPHAAWRWLTTCLVAMQLFNYLATRHTIAACLAFAGQVCLLKDDLLVLPGDSAELMPYGLVLVSVAVLLAALRERKANSSRADVQRVWLEFRDRYGALWALRLAERVNAVAAQQRSPFRLRWAGFRSERFDTKSQEVVPSSLDDDPILNTFEAILARFLRST